MRFFFTPACIDMSETTQRHLLFNIALLYILGFDIRFCDFLQLMELARFLHHEHGVQMVMRPSPASARIKAFTGK